jgi:hypothetical protein
MLRLLSSIIVGSINVVLGASAAASAPNAQVDPAVRDRVLPAAVQIAVIVEATENGVARSEYVPVGSGTIVSPAGLILTNWHVVDAAAYRQELQASEAHATADGVELTLELNGSQFLILTTERGDVPEPRYRAVVVAEEQALDLAVLQISAHADGRALDPASLALPAVPLGDSEALLQGDPVHIFAYPATGGGTLQYTAGVVSGFRFEDGIDGRAWITTDAMMSGGSSGGTAVDAEGRLIGVPTQGSELDCRPGDTNRDGRTDVQDVGCIPVGGSFGELRPIAVALPMLARAGVPEESVVVEEPPDDPYTPLTAEELGGSAPPPAEEPPESNIPVEVAEAPTPVPPAGAGDTAPTDSSAAATYVFAEDYCRTGPVYEPGTRIVLPREVIPGYGPNMAMREHEMVLSYAFPYLGIPAGTEVEITGPYIENGVCDLWPVRYRLNGVEYEASIDEWDLAPEFPNQIVPLPPERQSITSESEEFCRSNPNYAPSYANHKDMVLSHETPVYSHRRGYGFTLQGQAAAGMEIKITGPPLETGVCDMWPVTYVAPAPTPGPGSLTDEEYLLSGQSVRGYIHESDLRPG